MSAHTSITRHPLATRGGSENRTMNPARAYRQAGKAKRRAANPLGSVAAPVAFLGTEDAHALNLNPNTAKRHAARAGVNVNNDPASARRTRVSRNEGRRAHGEIARTPYLETWNARIPALGSTLSKRVPRA